MRAPEFLLEADFAAFVDSIPDAIAIVDAAGRITLANAQTEAVFGYSLGELQGQQIEMLLPERFRRDHPEHRKTFEESPRMRPMGSGLELYGRRQDGSEFPVEISLSPIQTRSGPMVIAAIRDVTERKRREQEIRSLNRQLDADAAYRSMVKHAPYGIYRVDLQDESFLTVNPALVQMLGYPDEQEVLHLSIPRDVYRNHPEYLARREQNRKERHFQGVEVEWKRRDGISLFVRLSGRRGKNEHGEEYIDIVAEDITDRRKLEEQFQQSQRLEAVARLAAGVSHDFNNLLGVITGYSWMLANDPATLEAQREKIDGILQAASSAVLLTRQLLAVSCKQVLQPAVLSLNAVVSEMGKMLNRVIAEDIKLVLEPASDLGSVKVDRTQIEQVLLNLVINARDAMPRGGSITIQTSNEHLDERYVAAHVDVKPGDYVMLAVSDNGIGMDKATQARAFEPFFTTKEPGKGTGLGLASVYGIVKQSGGHIWLYSEPGVGTTFKMYFPRVYRTAESAGARLHPEAYRGSETVLLVEDHALLRKMTAAMMRGMGYTVLETDGAEAALQAVADHQGDIHLLVTDVVMPSMNGLELREKVTALRPGIRTLLISGYSGDVISHYGDIGRGSALLEKPFSTESLGLRLRELLRAK